MTQRRKFKHNIYEQYKAIEAGRTGEWYKIFSSNIPMGEISSVLVENSNDWQEITPELVERWYKKQNIVGRFRKKKGDQYFFDNCVDIVDGHVFDKMVGEDVSGLIEATPDEIHKALDAIRIKKGLVEGVKFKIGPANIQLTLPTKYDAESDILKDGRSYAIYSNGAWVDKLSEPILVTEDNVEKYKGGYVWMIYPDFDLVGTGLKPDIASNDKIYFHHKQNAQSYIENYKPRFSRAEREKELRWIEGEIEQSFRIHSNPKYVEDELLATIQNLKQSK